MSYLGCRFRLREDDVSLDRIEISVAILNDCFSHTY